MLDPIGRVLETDEYRDHEMFSSGGQGAECIFHVCTPGFVDYLEITRGAGLEEGLEELAGLIAAAVTGVGEDRDLQIIGKPCGKLIGITLCQVFGYGHEHLIPPVLGRSITAQNYQSCRSKRRKYLNSHKQSDFCKAKIQQIPNHTTPMHGNMNGQIFAASDRLVISRDFR